MYLHIWEKGNVGMADLSTKLSSCFKHAMIDYLLEVCLLPLPIARPEESSVWGSPASSPSVFLTNEDRRGRTSIEQRERGSRQTSTEKKEAGSRRASVEKNLSMRKVSTSSLRSIETLPLKSGSSSRRTSVEGGSSRKSSGEKSPMRKVSNTSLRSIEASPSKPDTPERPQKESDAIVKNTTSDAMHPANGGSRVPSSEVSLTWSVKEKLRRDKETRDAYFQEAHLGQTGILEEPYHTTIPKYLAHACKLTSPSVSQFTYSFLGSYSAQAFVTKAIMCIQQICPDLILNAFKLKSKAPLGQYTHCTLDKDWSRLERTDELSQLHYIVVGRNPQQWEECCNPSHRSTQPWVDLHTRQSLQLFHPLDSRKVVRVPLQQSAVGGEAFVPRQRLVLMSITSQQVKITIKPLLLVYQARPSLTLQKCERESIMNSVCLICNHGLIHCVATVLK